MSAEVVVILLFFYGLVCFCSDYVYTGIIGLLCMNLFFNSIFVLYLVAFYVSVIFIGLSNQSSFLLMTLFMEFMRDKYHNIWMYDHAKNMLLRYLEGW